MYFSVGGASNDYIARVLLSQSLIFEPNLIVAYITHNSRVEFLDINNIPMIGPWCVNFGFKGARLYLDDLALRLYSYTTPELEFTNMAKNMLLLQVFCESCKINCVFDSVYKDDWFNKRTVSNPVCSQLVKLINERHYCNFNMEKIDSTSDNSHPGSKSNSLFAERLFETYQASIA